MGRGACACRNTWFIWTLFVINGSRGATLGSLLLKVPRQHHSNLQDLVIHTDALRRENALDLFSTESFIDPSHPDIAKRHPHADTHADSFGSRGGDFAGREPVGQGGWVQLICTCLVCLFFGFQVAYEGVTWLMGKMPFGLGTRENLQGSYLFWWILLMMEPSVLIPTSYELALEMNCTATTSGVLIGIGYLASPIGFFWGRHLFQEYSQFVVRGVCLAATFVFVVQNLVVAFVLDSSEEHGPSTMYFILVVRFIAGIAKVSSVCQLMAYKVTERQHRTLLSILTAIVTNAGLFFGPLLSAVSIHAMGGREQVQSVYTRTSTSLYMMAFLWAILGVAFSLTLPVDLSPWLSDEEAKIQQERIRISIEDRKAIVWQGLCYSAERALAVGAIEAGTAMILEVQFGWGTRAIGLGISSVFGFTMFFCATIMIVHAFWKINEVNALVSLSVVSAVGAVFLFDFDNHFALQVLLADALIYPFMYCANGITDGIVTRFAVPGTWYSLENYLAAKGSSLGLFRFLAFPLARFLIDTGGRNVYATCQLLIGILGLWSCIRLGWLVEWKARKDLTDSPSPSSPSPSCLSPGSARNLEANIEAPMESQADLHHQSEVLPSPAYADPGNQSPTSSTTGSFQLPGTPTRLQGGLLPAPSGERRNRSRPSRKQR
jgi:hypothetical protein